MRYRRAVVLSTALVLLTATLWMAAASARAAGTIAFVDAHRGWRVTYDGGPLKPGKNKAICWRTDNGGSTWRRVAAQKPFYTEGGGYMAGFIAFGSRDTGLWSRYSGRFLRTVNGGSAWSAVGPDLMPYVSDFCFATRKVAWASTFSYGSLEGTIRKSSDGGVTWHVVRRNQGEGTGSMSSPTAEECYVATSFGMLVTTDGGAHWASRSLPGGAPDFPLPGIGWSAGSGEVFKTVDGGVSWSAQPLPVSMRPTAIDFIDARHGWVVGASGRILRTSDGGLTWKLLTSGTRARLEAVTFVDGKHGWVYRYHERSSAVLLRTTDGGDTWKRLL